MLDDYVFDILRQLCKISETLEGISEQLQNMKLSSVPESNLKKQPDGHAAKNNE